MSAREPVGSLAEEAARLLAVVHGSTGGPRQGEPQPAALAEPGDAAPNGQASDREDSDREASDQAGSAGDRPRAAEDHHGGECRWCPLCQLMQRAKVTDPDVRHHLSQAAVSLALAVKGMLDDVETAPRRETPLEKIDLTEE